MAENWLVIDAHHHFFPEEATKRLGIADGMDYAASTTGKFARLYQQGKEIEHTVQVMDEAGVDMAVLNQSAWSPGGLAVCQAINNGYARVARDYPGRFIACAHIPLEAGQEALDELDRAVNELGCKGVSLVTSTSKVTLISKELFPLYQKISQLDIPIVIHPTIRVPLWGGTTYLVGSGVSREYDIAKATIEVMNNVLKEFPDLKFLMPHHGGGMPNIVGRVKARFEPEGWEVPEKIRGIAKTPREMEQLGLDKAFDELFGKLYFDTAGFGGWMPITKSATEVIRSDRLCFGTDYPYEIHEAEDIKAFIDNIKQLNIPETEKRNILGENIKTLFRLD